MPPEFSTVEERIIRTEGMYLWLYDRLSPANRDGIIEEAFTASRDRSDDTLNLFRFNGYWMARGAEAETVTWTFLLDGVYRIRLEVLPSLTDPRFPPLSSNNSLGGEKVCGYLNCPSGELLVSSITQIGTDNGTPIAEVPPGRYGVVVVSHMEEQGKHELLEQIEEYPPGDGPDWVIYLAPIPEANS